VRIRSLAVIALIAGTLSGVASAESPLSLFGKKETKPEGNGAPVDVDKVLRQGKDLLAMITLASDLGVDAAQHLMTLYPPEKVERLRILSARYNELKANRGSGDVDAEQLKVESEISAEIEKLALENDWKRNQKENAGAVRAAHAKLGLMLIADGLAAIQIPPAVDSLTKAINQVTKNPLAGMGKVPQIQRQIAVLSAVPGAAVIQVRSAKTVRGTCARIAEAEKFSLGADPPADSIKNVAELREKVTDLPDTSAPAEETNRAEVASTATVPSQPSSVAPQKNEIHEPTMAAQSSAPEPPPGATSTGGATAAETYPSQKDVVSEKKTVVDVGAPDPTEKTYQAETASADAGRWQPSSVAPPKNETHEPMMAAQFFAPERPAVATSTPAATLPPAPAAAASVVRTGQTTRVEGPDAAMVERLGIAIRQIARRGSCVQCRQLLQRAETLGALVESAQDPARTLDEYEALVKEIGRIQHG